MNGHALEVPKRRPPKRAPSIGIYLILEFPCTPWNFSLEFHSLELYWLLVCYLNLIYPPGGLWEGAL